MYVSHRRRLLERLRTERAAAVVPTASAKTRNHDCEYRFRPDSDFWYLTGFAEPESVLVLTPKPDGEDESVLFLRAKDREREIWTGRRLGLEDAPAALGVDRALPIDELWDALPKLLAGYERIVYRTGIDPENDRCMMAAIQRMRGLARGGVRPPAEIVDHVRLIHELRLKKSELEIAHMRRAAAITTEAHTAAMAAAAPGVGENELDALLEYTFRRRGSTGAAYTNIVAGGANACILHYVQNDQPLVDGDLVLIDAGAEWEYYASDVTRTFPVNGTFSDAQRALYEVVLDAQVAAIEHIRPGCTFTSVHDEALGRLVDGLIRLGLVQGSRAEVIESEGYKPYFMHRTSHWLGLDVHDCGYYSEEGRSRTLEPGIVLTVEPGLYVAPDDESVDPRWRGIGIRIEDDVLVTAAGHEVLTADIPKSVEDVEAACRGSQLASAR